MGDNSDPNAQKKLNAGAPSFVPNVSAQSFVPGQYFSPTYRPPQQPYPGYQPYNNNVGYNQPPQQPFAAQPYPQYNNYNAGYQQQFPAYNPQQQPQPGFPQQQPQFPQPNAIPHPFQNQGNGYQPQVQQQQPPPPPQPQQQQQQQQPKQAQNNQNNQPKQNQTQNQNQQKQQNQGGANQQKQAATGGGNQPKQAANQGGSKQNQGGAKQNQGGANQQNQQKQAASGGNQPKQAAKGGEKQKDGKEQSKEGGKAKSKEGADAAANSSNSGSSNSTSSANATTPPVSASGSSLNSSSSNSIDKNLEEEMTDVEPASNEINLEHEMAKLDIEMGAAKEHVNVLFMGHVDAGKSTTGGQILHLTGQVDKRTLEKFEREAKEKGRESWYLSWALDTNPEERDKGKTVEVGRASFETETKRYTILDAPGHKSYVPNMIGGAAQADVAILIISARKGEFEAGFDRQGQTREHAMLAKTAGVRKLIVAINKMDDPTVLWAEDRYTEIAEKIKPYLKQIGFNLKSDVEFMPISGFTGANLKDSLTKDVCPWYSGPSLLTYLDQMEKIQRNDNAPLRMPVNEKFKDMGTIVGGKIESGSVSIGNSVLIMPNQSKAEIIGIDVDEEPAQFARCGDNVLLKLRGVEEEEVSTGFVLCHPAAPVRTTKVFDAQLVILDFKNIICAGYSAVMHVHTLVEQVQILEIRHLIDKKTGRKSKQPPKFVKQGQICIVRLEAEGTICLETYDEYPQLGRFTLRDEGKTVAMGKVMKLITQVDA